MTVSMNTALSLMQGHSPCRITFLVLSRGAVVESEPSGPDSPSLNYLEHHGCHPAAGQQGQVEVQEGGDHRVTDVVVLAIGVKTSGGT